MTQSMTGYGRGENSSDRYQFGIEIRGTNHRFLEIKVRFPRELVAFESDVRSLVRSRFSRGYLDIQAFLGRPSTQFRRFVVDEELLAQVAGGLKEAGRVLDLGEELDLSVIARFREIFSFEDEEDDPEELRDGLMGAVAIALAEIEKSRRREGEEITRALGAGMERFATILERMQALAKDTNRHLAEGLRRRIRELLDQDGLSEERMNQEAAFLAMKADVTEELERLGGHFTVFMETLAQNTPAGRRMDFLLQEMNRELNTTASKAGTLELSHLAIEGKLELEKVREQVQNLE